MTNNSITIYTFEPGILRSEGGHYYLNVSGTLRSNAGDNQMAVAYVKKEKHEQYQTIRDPKN